MSPTGDPSDPATVFANVARLVYAKAEYDEVYQAIVDAATELVPACDHACLMVLRDRRLTTAAASSAVARRVDELERALGDGPCVDAITSEGYQIDADITVQSAWPRLAERIMAETPVRGMTGHRILVDGEKVAALNMFSETPGAMDEQSADQGVVLASFASVALSALARNERAESLQRGLASNREIGKAVGLLMAAHRVGSDEAFQLLRKASTDLNIKLTRVAQEVIDHHESRGS